VCGNISIGALAETWREIESDGFAIERARWASTSRTIARWPTAEAAGKTMLGCAHRSWRASRPNRAGVGDRYEILAACGCRPSARIPIAHLHGGEITEAGLDDAIRHSISKMAALHFRCN